MALPEETIRKVFGANAAGDEEAAAIAQLHSIAAGLLNTGYYARFFKEETTGKKWKDVKRIIGLSKLEVGDLKPPLCSCGKVQN